MTKKARPKKYEEKIVVQGDFEEIMKALKPKKKAVKKKPKD